jgi:hypothetical protein
MKEWNRRERVRRKKVDEEFQELKKLLKRERRELTEADHFLFPTLFPHTKNPDA